MCIRKHAWYFLIEFQFSDIFWIIYWISPFSTFFQTKMDCFTWTVEPNFKTLLLIHDIDHQLKRTANIRAHRVKYFHRYSGKMSNFDSHISTNRQISISTYFFCNLFTIVLCMIRYQILLVQRTKINTLK